MHIHTVMTTNHSLLRSIREALGGADEALLCVAFATEPGIHLVGRELRELGTKGRLLVTTTFGSTTAAALNRAHEYGNRVAVLNPGAGTYHPKLYIGRHAREYAAVIGSANLTGGLVSNVELATSMRGRPSDEAISEAWRWADETWHDERVVRWSPRAVSAEGVEKFADDLWPLLQREVKREPVFLTLGSQPRENRVGGIHPGGIYMATDRSAARRTGPQFIPAWMFNLAWEYLKRHGELSNRHLLDELRVHRSSAVCAVLARIPSVQAAPGTRIKLVKR